MRSNLSFDTFATVLAALGASTLVACAGQQVQPVQAHEVAPTSPPAGHAQASCSANSCGSSATAAPVAPAGATSPQTSGGYACADSGSGSNGRRDRGGPRGTRSDPRARVGGDRTGDAGGGEGAQSGSEEGRKAVERRSQLRRWDLLGRDDEEDLVNRRIEGVGLGLRWDFIDDLIARLSTHDDSASGSRTEVPIDFLEISPENYIGRGGRHPAALGWLAERLPVITHGLTLSLGGADPLDEQYLGEVRKTVVALASPWHSDHMCFGSADGRSLHDLLPVAFKRSNVSWIADRIRRARDALGVPLAIENVSYYWHPGRADTGEAEFLSAVCEAADCGFMFDVNNAYVNATNFGFDIHAWLRAAPLDRVVQMHVAGHEWFDVDPRGLGAPAVARAPGAMIVDTHGAEVDVAVLELLGDVLIRTGPVPIVVERDQNVPDLDTLLVEVERVRRAVRRAPLRARSEDDAARAEIAE